MKKRRARTREGMIVTSMALPEKLHRRLAIAALDRHVAIAELVREAIETYLRRPTKARRGGKS